MAYRSELDMVVLKEKPLVPEETSGFESVPLLVRMGLRADARAPHAAQALTSSSRPSWRRQRPEPRQPRLPPLLRQLLLPARTLLQLRPAADAPRHPTGRSREIGRASCRERVGHV